MNQPWVFAGGGFMYESNEPLRFHGSCIHNTISIAFGIRIDLQFILTLFL
jgi:hypothetical protein